MVIAIKFSVVLRPQRPLGLLETAGPRTAISTSTPLLSCDYSLDDDDDDVRLNVPGCRVDILGTNRDVIAMDVSPQL